MADIVYEDNHLLIAEKPQGQLTQSDETGDLSLHDELKGYIKEKYQKPGEVYLGLVHRLDRPVGGLVAFARTSKAASRLSEQLRSHSMERQYLCVVEGCGLPREGDLTDWLLADEQGMVRSVKENTPGAKAAKLHFAKLGESSERNETLLHIRLETGRKHQIRVQLSHMGHPIRWDMRYGHGEKGKDIALWGAVLNITHPTKKEPLAFTSFPRSEAFLPWKASIELFLQSIVSHIPPSSSKEQ